MTEPFLTLFWWMSHVGQGTHQRLFDAAQSLHPSLSAETSRSIARRFLDASKRLGHVASPKANYWQMYPSSLTMRSDGNGAFWRGGLSPELLQRVKENSANQVTFSEQEGRLTPPSLRIRGPIEDILRLAETLGARFEADAAANATSSLPSIQSILSPSVLPTTQMAKLSRVWEPDRPHGCVRSIEVIKFKPEQDRSRYFIRKLGTILEAKSELEAIYGAAWRQHRLCRYEAKERCFRTDIRLPVGYALPLCLCSGNLPDNLENTQVYRNIPPEIGNLLLRQLGQDSFPPTIRWMQRGTLTP